MRRILGSVALCWMVVIGGACAGSSEVEVESAASPVVQDSIYVRFINNHFYDARVYVLYGGGARHPLGIIVGKSEGEITPILWQPRTLEFEISFIWETGLYLSDDLSLEPGDIVNLTIPPNIASSTFFRRAR